MAENDRFENGFRNVEIGGHFLFVVGVFVLMSHFFAIDVPFDRRIHAFNGDIFGGGSGPQKTNGRAFDAGCVSKPQTHLKRKPNIDSMRCNRSLVLLDLVIDVVVLLLLDLVVIGLCRCCCCC